MTTTHDDELRETRNKIAAAIWTADKRPEFEVLNDIMRIVKARELAAQLKALKSVKDMQQLEALIGLLELKSQQQENE